MISIVFFLLLLLFRNEKRRIEGTGEAPTWQYYHEVDELLGSHNEHSLDLSNLDESNIAHSTSISKEISGSFCILRVHFCVLFLIYIQILMYN